MEETLVDRDAKGTDNGKPALQRAGTKSGELEAYSSSISLAPQDREQHAIILSFALRSA